MSFRRPLRSILTALLGVFAAATPHAQQYQQPVVIPTGNWPVAVYSADLNEDGKPDLIYIDAGATPAASTTHILLNNGDGTFRTGATLATAGSALAIGHFSPSTSGNPSSMSRDAHVDIAWVSVSGTTYTAHFAFGNGDGTFAATVNDFATVTGTKAPNIVSLVAAPGKTGQADFIFTVDAANTPGINVFFGTGFYIQENLGPSGAGTLQLADLNGDGQTDQVLTAPGKGTDVTLSALVSSTSTPVSYPSAVASTLLVDMDGDGRLDLVSEGTNGRLDIYHGNGDGTFSTTSEIGTGASDGRTGSGGHLIAIADLNGDGILDILTSTPNGISVLLGTGGLNYKLGGLYNAGPGRASYALADFNGDGHLDLAVDSPEGIAILYGNADGSFQTSRSYSAGQPAYSLALGRFTSATIPVTGPVDAVVTTGIPQFQVLSGDNKGGFSVTTPPWPAGASQTNSTRSLWSSVVQGYFDGDAILDLAVTENGKPSPTDTGGITLYYGQPYRTFTAPVVADPSGSQHIGTSSVATFSGDGVVHFLNVDTTACGSFAITSRTTTTPDAPFHSNPTGSLYNLVAPGYLTPGNASVSKFDVVCELNGSLYIYKNNGSGGFLPPAVLPAPSGTATTDASGNLPSTGFFPSALAFTDIDGDGLGDVIVAYHNLASDPAHPTANASNNYADGDRIYIYWQAADGSFGSNYMVLYEPRNFYQLAIADLDGPGIRDLVESDGYLLNVVPIDHLRRLGLERTYLAGMGINGIATLTLNGLPAIIVANGGSVLSGPAVNRGTLASNTDVNTGGITVLFFNPATTTTPTGTLTASPEPSQYGQTFTLTATLTGSGSAPTGTVDFSIDGTDLGTATVTAGVATYTVVNPAYAVGTHTLTAVYSGDTNYGTLTLTGSHDISLLPSTTYLTGLATTIHYGEIIGDIAVAHADAATTTSASTDGGTIIVYIDGVNTCVLNTGTGIACPATTGAGYSVGSYSVVLVYSGNAYFAGSTSITYTVNIIPDDTSGILASSNNPSTFGSAVTLSATFTSAIYPPTGTVSAPFATPTGTVTFYDGATPIGTGTLNAAGTASFTTSALAIGTHNITAVLASSLNFNGSTTAIFQQTVVPAPQATRTFLTSSLNPSTIGQTVTFSALVTTGAVVSQNPPTGSITFTADGVLLGTVVLNGFGGASLAVSTLTVGNHTIVASFTGSTAPGGGTFLSSSDMLTQQVNPLPIPPSFTLTVTPTTLSVPIGNSAIATVTITPLGGFNQVVNLACGSLPRAVTCTFDSTAITGGSGTTRLHVFATAPHDCDNSTPYFITPSGPVTWLGLLATSGLVLLIRRRRKLIKGIVLMLALSILPFIGGCGHCTDLGVFPGGYTFTVTATTTGTISQTATQTIQMTAHL